MNKYTFSRIWIHNIKKGMAMLSINHTWRKDVVKQNIISIYQLLAKNKAIGVIE